MKTYQKPEVEYVSFVTEEISTIIGGETDVVSGNVPRPVGDEV